MNGNAKRQMPNAERRTLKMLSVWSFAFCVLSFSFSACKMKLSPTYPAAMVAESLRQMCRRDYRLSVETRHSEKTLQTMVWKAGLFSGQLYDLQGMRKEALETMEHLFLCATRVALSTDAPLDFIEVKMADVLSGASITLWRYVPDIRDSMYQRIGDTEYFNRLVVEIAVDKSLAARAPVDERKPGSVKSSAARSRARTSALEAVQWAKPLTMAEFLAKQIILRARRTGGDSFQAHADLSQPATLGVVIDNWPSIEEEGPEHVARVTDSVHQSAQAVLKGYRFSGFRGITLRDSQGVALRSWNL